MEMPGSRLRPLALCGAAPAFLIPSCTPSPSEGGNQRSPKKGLSIQHMAYPIQPEGHHMAREPWLHTANITSLNLQAVWGVLGLAFLWNCL